MLENSFLTGDLVFKRAWYMEMISGKAEAWDSEQKS